MAQRQQPVALTALMLLVCAGLPACGTTGDTSRFALPLEVPQSPQGIDAVRVASAAMDENAAYLNAVNVRPWGKFGPNDLSNIEDSLRDTLAPYATAPSRAAESRLDIHLVIRRYVVGVSNTGGAVLACVAWAATFAQGTLIFQEQFYAADAGYLIGTIGLLKDAVHKAIVRRIATTALALASGPAAAERRPTTFDNTSTSLEEATSRLPRALVSLGDPGLMAFPSTPMIPAVGNVVKIVGATSVSGVSRIQWELANPSEKFDWGGYLQKVYSRP